MADQPVKSELAAATRIEGGAVICSYCNRVLTFNMIDRPNKKGCSCDRARAERDGSGLPPHSDEATVTLDYDDTLAAISVMELCNGTQTPLTLRLRAVIGLSPTDDLDAIARSRNWPESDAEGVVP